MPCDTRPRRNQTFQERQEEARKAIAGLDTKLRLGQVKVVVDRSTGAVGFTGWSQQDRSDITDVCAYRVLSMQSSFALRQAVQRAEQLSGRKVNPQAVAAGVHTHDNGKTWSTH